ncbi:MAG: ABC transporter ATP-binding protein [Dehalococcoidia bacterium]|nr:ABC transporter ATP-binding protein [Dehalococcoidia bacterium]
MSSEIVIRLTDITKVYKTGAGEVHALAGVSFAVERGEMVALMGPSGSGKSTLMNVLGCLDRPTSGEYLLEGQDVGRMRDAELARIRSNRIGFVFQSFNLLSRMNALDNVALPLLYSGNGHDGRARAEKALSEVGLAHRASHRPNQLSGGEQQRVAVARSLVNNPSFILADEPTGNLDTRTSEEIMHLFRSLQDRGITVVVVTHERDIAEWCGRTIMLRDGKLVGEDRHPQKVFAHEPSDRA